MKDMKTMTAAALSDMTWIVPPECQGQMVEVSYADPCDGMAYRRVFDRSDRSVSYSVASFSKMSKRAAEGFSPVNSKPTGIRWQALKVVGA